MFRKEFITALRRSLISLGTVILITSPSLSQAQSWPDKPVKLIVPFAAGGTTDILGRIFAQQMTNILGQNVIVENKGGAGGNIGAEVVANAPPNGYTLLLASGSMMTVNPYLYKKLPLNYATDLTYITAVAGGPMLVSVSPNLPVNNLKELISLAKAKELTFGSAGIGSQVHMAGENFTYAAGIAATHIPYKGEAPAINDLISGQIDFMVGNLPAAAGFAKAGKIKALAITSSKRVAQLPDVPTVAEAAIPGFVNVGWYALAAPAGTPKAIVEKIYIATQKALESEAMRKSLEINGLTAIVNAPKELDTQIKNESASWEKVIKARNIQAQ
ncbi:tripartite tricarboxylate transporter substrate binding protein [Polynucleobacter sp. AP-Kaivos-20-H2]|uniref:Bug family tripartite tricarboxylate transporter substrate binding protein n=1 Tax=Polynucleobacter sp. AP-Kaivos-20-H2 TaxID=2689104 RepID=UPI001C0E856C|nr:tripartite tricarboxylate transporter substrate binding protein [Polynucleobacter sp. AP-Kaivos-20-H2]MBU3603913.1 tripartite tricarboxylate transporter substrate binding protein [Polynucleobacter sp. AP-Kaivos-20-H2]